jgi:hypothetical protein
MAPSSRDRISVDLHGLKAALFKHAQALGVSPSGLVRETLANALGGSEALVVERPRDRHVHRSADRVRLSLRMTREQVAATLAAARRAGLSPGDYVADLVAGVPALASGASRTDHLAALIASSAEVSTLIRSIHHLTTLLRQGEVRAALEYRQMLNTLAGDVRSHLTLTSRVLADLRPRSSDIRASRPPART